MGYIHSHWPLNELSGNAINPKQPSGTFNLTQTGTVPSTSGKFGLARGPMSASGNYFTGPVNSVYDGNVFAYEIWFKTTVTGVVQILGGKWTANVGWKVGLGTDSKIYYVNDATTVFAGNGAALNDGLWHYLFICNLVTSGTNNLRYYIDGSLVAQTTGRTFTEASAVPMYVGSRGDSDPFQGLIDSAAYWSTVPSSWTEVELIISKRYANGIGREYAYAPGYIQKSTISSVSGNKLITATRLTRQDATNQNPIIYQRNAVIT